MLAKYILIGEVLKPQGVHGLVKVRPDTDDPARYQRLQDVLIKRGEAYVQVPVEEVSVRDDAVFLRLDHAATREQAEAQRGLMLYVDRAHTVELAENETLICDLIGCRVMDESGCEIGVIRDVLQPGGNDVYVVKCKQGEMLLPALMHVVPKIDTEAGIVVVVRDRLREVAVCDWDIE